VLAATAAAALALPAGTGLAATHPHPRSHPRTFADYNRTDLVSGNPHLTPTADQNTVNPWGVSELLHGPLWVSNEGHANTTCTPARTTARRS
jgi:hypothetical protein